MSSSTVGRALRYEHIVDHCVSLLCAQWCTDVNVRVVLSVWSKTLLGMAGIGSHGRSVLDCSSEYVAESVHKMKCRYANVLRVQRYE